MSAEGEQNMKPNEVRAYLARWVLEFGTRSVSWNERAENQWYNNELHVGATVDHPDVRKFIPLGARAYAMINEAGLQFLKGDADDSP